MSRVGIKLRIVVLGGFAALVPVATAAAQAAPLRFDARLLPSGGVLAATAAGALAPVIFAAHLPHATCAPCDPAGLTFLDRGTVGDVRGGAATASDVALFATGGVAGLLLIAESRADLGIVREDFTVLAQAVGTATVLTNWSKVAFHRPRPYRYVAAAGSGGAAESGLSFPSGHTSAAFAAAFAYWSIQARRGTAAGKAPRIATLVALAAATGVLRVVAREHFPTDVVAGAALGAAIGWTVPRLYPVRR
jgi:membrane-associated phospholipid phosphatase